MSAIVVLEFNLFCTNYFLVAILVKNDSNLAT